MNNTSDVVIVGSGIAGGALATALARAGVDVLLLERQTAFRDRVRGEAMANWGVAEVLQLGLEDLLLDAGGGYTTRFVLCDEVLPEPEPMLLPDVVPGTAGLLNVGHPQACEALLGATAAFGGTVVRGVGDVEVTVGPSPEVRYEHDGREHSVRARIVVGADGRQSTVRKALALTLHQTPVRTMGGGMLIDELDGWPGEDSVLGTEGDLFFLVFPRPGNIARLYLWHALDERPEFSGPGRHTAFLESFRFDCLPAGEAVAKARPAGQCAFFPSLDTWVDQAYEQGAVLVGDAGGFTDPVIGQGLSSGFRDARLVSEILLTSDDWSPDAFAGYGEERAERLRRIRVSSLIQTEIRAVFTPAARERRRAFQEAAQSDALLAAPLAALIAGYDCMPAEAFSQENIDRILNLGG